MVVAIAGRRGAIIVNGVRRFLASPRARRAAVLAGKASAGVAAAGAGLALGLHEAKRALRAEEPVDLWREASFSTRGAGDRTAGAGAALERLAKKGNFSRDDFQAAARRLKPVELHLEELLEATKASGASAAAALEDDLLARWRAAGYLDASAAYRSRADLFGRRLTGDAQGVDVGVEVPPYLLRSGSATEAPAVVVRPPQWPGGAELREEVLKALRRWGCALLRDAITPEDVALLRQQLGLGVGAYTRRAGEVGQWLMQKDSNISMGRYTFGRLHCLLRGSPELEPPAVAAHAAVGPLVHSFFREEEAAGQSVFLSEAQLIVADPFAEAQFWHLESVGGRGLTVFIPLSDIAFEKGPQAVLPGTHCLHDRALSWRQRLRGCFGALCASHGASAAAAEDDRVWRAGDALVLDAALLHRGLANDSLGAPAAVLVLRYDLASSPPPGCDRRWLLTMTAVGRVLEAVFKLYAVV